MEDGSPLVTKDNVVYWIVVTPDGVPHQLHYGTLDLSATSASSVEGYFEALVEGMNHKETK
jgi:hypothetical protein